MVISCHPPTRRPEFYQAFLRFAGRFNNVRNLGDSTVRIFENINGKFTPLNSPPKIPDDLH
jgi:hypothetical protein